MPEAWISSPASQIAPPVVGIPTFGWSGGPLQCNNFALSSVGLYTVIYPVLGDAVLVRSAKFGTLSNDCLLSIEFAIDDTATAFAEALTWTNAQITNANGLSARVPAAGKFYRFRFTLGTTSPGNGLNIFARS